MCIRDRFYDNDKYFDFVRRCREAGIDIPIIPGVKPIVSRAQLKSIPRTFSIDIPEELRLEIESCDTDEKVRQVGEEWCVEQSRGLIKGGAPCIHYYTMSKVDGFVRIARQVF